MHVFANPITFVSSTSGSDGLWPSSQRKEFHNLPHSHSLVQTHMSLMKLLMGSALLSRPAIKRDYDSMTCLSLQSKEIMTV